MGNKAKSIQRLWDLMELPGFTEEGRQAVQESPWGLGDKRTLEQFIEFTGVRKRPCARISACLFPPFPPTFSSPDFCFSGSGEGGVSGEPVDFFAVPTGGLFHVLVGIFNVDGLGEPGLGS